MASAGMRQDGGQSVGNHGAGRRNILGASRKTTRDHHQTVGAESRGFVDGALTVVDRGVPSPLVICGEHPSPTMAGDLETVGLDDARGFAESDGFDLIAPWRYSGDPLG